uniref:Uncharacterized protein n=1 Tax=Anguilla anguilla TaxID=7936 RepID=A0A0E9USS4_ANGAN
MSSRYGWHVTQNPVMPVYNNKEEVDNLERLTGTHN